MTTSNYPKTVTIHGSGGDAEYCAVTGEAVTDPYTNEDFLLARIDLKEYLEYWLHLDPDGIPLEIDVLDIAGWVGTSRPRSTTGRRRYSTAWNSSRHGTRSATSST